VLDVEHALRYVQKVHWITNDIIRPMPTAEQLLRTKKMCEVIPVSFPAGTLFPPFEAVTHGILYKAAPVGTPSLAINKEQGFEYYIANCLGDVLQEEKAG